MTDLICQNERRREAVRRHAQLYGLDYLEVGADQRTLTVHFLGKAPPAMDKRNVLIEGGRRLRDLRVLSAELEFFDDPEVDDTLEVVVDRAGDFSTYTLRIVARDAQGRPQPHPDFDPRYDHIDFNFKVDCPSELDCQDAPRRPPDERLQPEISYLAKDYASFRQLIFDRLALVMPDWKERHVPDFGVAMVELLAYVGDYLSYYQDAVATEAYLGMARRRISVQRHARLVDYRMHEGNNARAWVAVEIVSEALMLNPRDIFFITRLSDSPYAARVALPKDDLEQIAPSGYEVFEPLLNAPISLYQTHNQLRFYTWGDDECCLERGATTATLIGELVAEEPEPPPTCDPPKPKEYAAATEQRSVQPVQTEPPSTPKLYLRVGDVLIFEEVIGPKTGLTADADPAHRHAVRLTRVEAAVDPLNGQSIVEIAWAAADALPFPLCLSALGPPPECAIIRDISVARGNVVLVDHGQSVDETLADVPQQAIIESCAGEGELTEVTATPGRYRPKLRGAPLTFSAPALASTPAADALRQDVRAALAQVWLTTRSPTDDAKTMRPLAGDADWSAQRDLLESLATEQHFVAEIDDDGRANLRFGDGELGRRPEVGMKFHAYYRVGNGLAGNVGMDAIAHLVATQKLSGNITRVRNPLAASGGSAPEPVAKAKLCAPHAFRGELQRAIIAEDYAALVARDSPGQVQRAAATLRWNGSWYEAQIAVDQIGQAEASAGLLKEIEQRLHRYRRIGHDMRVQTARLVPLLLTLYVCVRPHYLRGHVEAALREVFSNRTHLDGSKGFFHPDNLSFGEGIYLSRLVAAAQVVAGVETVEVGVLQRVGEGDNSEVANGVLPLGAFEIAQLDNDPSFPERGTLTLNLGGGR